VKKPGVHKRPVKEVKVLTWIVHKRAEVQKFRKGELFAKEIVRRMISRVLQMVQLQQRKHRKGRRKNQK